MVALDFHAVARLSPTRPDRVEERNWGALVSLPVGAINNLAARAAKGATVGRRLYVRTGRRRCTTTVSPSSARPPSSPRTTTSSPRRHEGGGMAERRWSGGSRARPPLPETKRVVRQRLLDYLGTNQNLLDMYPAVELIKRMEMLSSVIRKCGESWEREVR